MEAVSNGNQVTSHMLMMMNENVEILSEVDDQLSLENAAQQCRLPGNKLTSQEAACFPDIANAHLATQKLYLYLRNRILTLWQQNCRNELTYEFCMSHIASPYDSDPELIRRIHGFLNRYGFINYGVYKVAKPPTRKCLKVIVIGAGIAGLILARQLQSFGCEVLVVEARARVGGRINTFNKGPYTADLGAMVITGLGGNPISILARQIPMEVQRIRSKCPLYERNGVTVPKERDEAIEKEFNKILEASTYMAHSMNIPEMSLGEAIDLIVKLQEKQVRERQIEYWKTMVELQEKMKKNLHRILRLRETIQMLHEEYKETATEAANPDTTSITKEFLMRSKRRDLNVAHKDYDRLLEHQREIEDALRELDACRPSDTYLNQHDRQIFDWHTANLEFANAAPASKLSLKHWDQDDEFELSGSHLNIPGGYSIVPIHLAAGLNIRMNTAVSEVRYTDDGVEVEVYESISGSSDITEVLKADTVVSTLPLGVLKMSLKDHSAQGAVKFSPPLPQWKLDAIDRLGFGNLNKVALCFDRIFWDPNVNVFGQVAQTSQSRGEFFQFWNLSKDPTSSPVLMGLVAGEAAEHIESLNDNIIIGNALSTLKRIFGSSTPSEVAECVITRWRADPWSRGSYSYVAVQATGDDYDLLAAPVAVKEGRSPRLFFAGEHTIRNYPATVHGALLSGLREAGRIADQFLGIPYGPTVDGK